MFPMMVYAPRNQANATARTEPAGGWFGLTPALLLLPVMSLSFATQCALSWLLICGVRSALRRMPVRVGA